MTGIPVRLEWTRQPGTGPPISILGPIAGRDVIEIGCGSGHNLAYLVAHCAATGTGIDCDPVKITRARTRYGQIPRLGFILGEATATLTGMSAGSADICLSIFGALSFTTPGPLLTAAARVLRPGGLLAITLRAGERRDYVTVLRRKTARRVR